MPTVPRPGPDRAGAFHAIQGQALVLYRAHRAVRAIQARRAEIQRQREESAGVDEIPLRAADVAELAETAYRLTGLRLSPNAVCPGHCAPLEAFASAFFGRNRVEVWKGSRGLGGKTTMLALLAHLETIVLGAEVTILGGSGQQSQRVHDAQDAFWRHENAPRRLLVRDPTTYETELTNGGKTIALMASQTSARGPHPQRLRLDEVDEMKLSILEAAQGQPMSKRGIVAQTVMSSTHQHADGTMTSVLKRATERGWPVREWCYKENLVENGGWLSQAEVDAKRDEVTSAMWDAEYDLQEPSPEGRAIDTASVEATFRERIGEYVDVAGQEIIVEPPVPGAVYATGADWAKERDWTVIITFRVDTSPWRLVAYLRDGRRPWHQMIDRYDDRVRRYPGRAAHDGTGLGDVVDDLVTVDAEGVQLTGRRRSDLLNEYVKEIERKHIVSARISTAYAEHRYAKLKDLYGDGHLPDTICAGALAVYAHRHGQSKWGWGAV